MSEQEEQHQHHNDQFLVVELPNGFTEQEIETLVSNMLQIWFELHHGEPCPHHNVPSFTVIHSPSGEIIMIVQILAQEQQNV